MADFAMNDRIRIVASGEFLTGGLQFRLPLIPPPEMLPRLPASWDTSETDEVWRQAIAHGALLVEVDVMDYEPYFDEENDYHEEDDSYFGAITYGEYWAAYPEERPVNRVKPMRPDPCWEPRLILMFRAPSLRLRSPQIDQHLIAKSVYDPETERYLFAVVLPANISEIEGSDESIPVIQPNFIRPLSIDRFSGWQLGENITVEVCPYPATAQRAWDWGSRSSFPYLCIDVDRTAEQLQAWFNSLKLYHYHYEVHEKIMFRGEESDERVCDRYRPIDPGIYNFKSENDNSRDLYLLSGHVYLLHKSWYKQGQEETDSTMLASILAGDLGDVKGWVVIEGDWVVPEAAGRGIDSLQNYLDPNGDENLLRQEWKRWIVTIDIRAARNENQVMAILGEFFQVPINAANPTDCVLAWLATAPITALPRHIYFDYDKELDREIISNCVSHLATGKAAIGWKAYCSS